jgi:hypothetical protein
MSTPEEKRKENQRFITEKIDPYINRMLSELLEEKPANVVKARNVDGFHGRVDL